MSKEETENFLAKYRDPETRKLKNMTATQFSEAWNYYDKDGNGYIEDNELDNFLRQLICSVTDCGDKVISENALKVMKDDFMEAFDTNDDKRIDISELSQILPADETFLLLFRRDNPLHSSVEFMKIWKQFDKDRSGYIEANELKDFIKAYLQETKSSNNLSEELILEYTDTMLQLFDRNHDGKLQLSEMSRLLPVKENYLCRPIFKNASRITSYDINVVFRLYDQDRNNYLENEELQGFLKDLLDLVQEDYDEEDFKFFMKVILNEWDVDHDGKISKDELRMMLVHQSKLNEKELITHKSASKD